MIAVYRFTTIKVFENENKIQFDPTETSVSKRAKYFWGIFKKFGISFWTIDSKIQKWKINSI